MFLLPGLWSVSAAPNKPKSVLVSYCAAGLAGWAVRTAERSSDSVESASVSSSLYQQSLATSELVSQRVTASD